MKLNLGCGNRRFKRYRNLTKKDLDLNTFPYPFKDNSVDEILLYFVLEHLNNPVKVLEELHRISKPSRLIKLKLPYGIRWMDNLEHKRGYTEKTFKNFSNSYITKVPFKLNKIRYYPYFYTRFIPFWWIIGRYLNRFIKNIYIELKVEKG